MHVVTSVRERIWEELIQCDRKSAGRPRCPGPFFHLAMTVGLNWNLALGIVPNNLEQAATLTPPRTPPFACPSWSMASPKATSTTVMVICWLLLGVGAERKKKDWHVIVYTHVATCHVHIQYTTQDGTSHMSWIRVAMVRHLFCNAHVIRFRPWPW